MAEKKDNEIYLTRLYDAPVKLVWDAYTDPKHQAKWWGPRGFTITTKSKDLRPGGKWIYTMHGPDGKDWPNIATYLEVEPYKRLVYDHGATETTPPLFRMTVIFTKVEDKTLLELTMTFESPEVAKQMGGFIKQAGGNSTWDRLGEYLDQETKGEDNFIINRSFNAPIATVFKAWTDPKHFSKWLPPTGFTMEILRGKVAVGDGLFYSMGNGSFTMYGRSKYLEITPVTKLVYTQQFVDKDEKISRHPGAPTWPETMLSHITFHEEGPNQTRVTVVWSAYGEASAAERKSFHDAKDGMTMGWTGSFDKLEELLASL